MRTMDLIRGALLFAAAMLGGLAQGQTPPPGGAPVPGVVRLQVDARDVERRIFRVAETLPVAAPGPLRLLFPRYLPGHHGPFGEIERFAGLMVRGGGQPLAWRRDLLDPYAFEVDVPAGVGELALEFQFLSAVGKGSSRVVMTREMLNLQWNSVLLYPAGYGDRALTYEASVQLPAGWRQASALAVAGGEGDAVRFKPVTLQTLVDSPLFAGRHLRRVELEAPGAPRPVVLNIVADQAALLQPGEPELKAHRELVVQADRLFGARHFATYDFLLALSDELGFIGLEHHESSENGVLPGYFKDWAKRSAGRDLLAHEYVHSWNGKFRRPADLWTPGYEVPMKNSLLWVYEGQTQFWGEVLAARSGLVTAEQARDRLANIAASYEARAGRAWRNLQDTTNQAAMGPREGGDWRNWQRGYDYYDESLLIWLEADMLIREQSHGRRSMDDFARAFFGVQDGRIEPLTYTFDDVVAALQQVRAVRAGNRPSRAAATRTRPASCCRACARAAGSSTGPRRRASSRRTTTRRGRPTTSPTRSAAT